jgi:hypothetical protein
VAVLSVKNARTSQLLLWILEHDIFENWFSKKGGTRRNTFGGWEEFSKRGQEEDRIFGCLGCILNKERFVWMMEKWKLSNESRGLYIHLHLPRQATGNHQPFTSIFGSGTNRVLDISMSF